jgi:dimethylargininase
MLTAITREVSPSMNRCELTFLDRREIDIGRAVEQHRDYERCLAALGIVVVPLEADPDLPDSVFVEDPAVVVDEVAVMTRMGAASRRAESEFLARVLELYRPLQWLTEPATLEGGDVVRVGRKIFGGRSKRTNEEGIRQLVAALDPFGYTVTPVDVHGCLHLKSACCSLGDGALLVNRDWIDVTPFAGFRLIDVLEPWAADVLAVRDEVLMPAGFPETAKKLEGLGWRVQKVDVSELRKAEAGVTCMSVIFET